MRDDLLRGTTPRVFTTNPDNPSEGRVFVWRRTRWYERVEVEDTGPIAFTPVAESEEELRHWLSQSQSGELLELDDDFAQHVREQFLDQTPLYPEAPELSDQPPEEGQGPVPGVGLG